MIGSLEVVKEPLEINGIQYSEQIRIGTKDSTELKFVSLSDIRARYTKFGSKPVLFMVDGKLINSDYDQYRIDERYISEVLVDHIKNPGGNIDLGVIKVLTKSKLDIYFKGSNRVIVRGREMAKNL